MRESLFRQCCRHSINLFSLLINLLLGQHIKQSADMIYGERSNYLNRINEEAFVFQGQTETKGLFSGYKVSKWF